MTDRAQMRKFLKNLHCGETIRIAVADAHIFETDQIGDLAFSVHTCDGLKRIFLQDIVYMPEFPRGLISIAKLSQ